MNVITDGSEDIHPIYLHVDGVKRSLESNPVNVTYEEGNSLEKSDDVMIRIIPISPSLT